jgi:hypothetical protein
MPQIRHFLNEYPEKDTPYYCGGAFAKIILSPMIVSTNPNSNGSFMRF